MFRSIPRARHWPLALLAFAAGACADAPTSIRIPTPTRPNANLGDIITVTTTSGGKDVGSLRWAVAQTTGGEIVRFAPEIAGATIVVDSTIPVKYPITIEGPQDKGVTISGGNARHIFDVGIGLPSATTFRNLSLVNGEGSGSAGGGGMLASSDVVLENVTVSNHNGMYYAAMFVNANATFINTTISSNTSGNLAALFVEKKLTLVNSTIAYNNKGGVDVRGVLAMRNSMITHNGAGANCQSVPAFERTGRNLTDDLSCGDSTTMIIAPALLNPLADNGGPGKTHSLMGGSPAVNAGQDCTVTVDQRYVTRDAVCDIGAYEFRDFTNVTLTNNSSPTVNTSTGWVLLGGSIKCSTNETLDLAVEISQEQKAGRNTQVVKASGKVTVACGSAAQPWGIALAPTSGAFTNGNATVTTKTAAGAWVIPSSVTTSAKIFKARK